MFNNQIVLQEKTNVNKSSILPLFHTKAPYSYEIKVVVICNNENCSRTFAKSEPRFKEFERTFAKSEPRFNHTLKTMKHKVFNSPFLGAKAPKLKDIIDDFFI